MSLSSGKTYPCATPSPPPGHSKVHGDDEVKDDASECTEFWLRCALQDEDYSSDDGDNYDDSLDDDSSSSEEEKETIVAAAAAAASVASSKHHQQQLSPSKNLTSKEPKIERLVEAVQSTRIVIVNNSNGATSSGSNADSNIELQQVWEEDDDDDATVDSTMRHSDSAGSNYTMNNVLNQRMGQPLLFLQQHQMTAVNQTKKKTATHNNKQVCFFSTKLRLFVEEKGKLQRPLSRITDLMAVEAGRAVIVCKQPGNARSMISPTRPPSTNTAATTTTQQHPSMATDKLSNNNKAIVAVVSSEVGYIGGAWRGALKRLLLCTLDQVNWLRLARILQANLQFLTSYEVFVLAELIEGLDRGTDLNDILHCAFQNRNVSRLIVQALGGGRYDFIYHWPTAVTRNRAFDLFSQLVPVLGGITTFPATENFPTTRNHALASIFRVVLGPGNWLTRVLTGGRQGLTTDNPNAPAQNLAAESNGFELANRNQYGTHFGRIQTNKFRLAHRLPTDESLVRSFIAVPIPTMTNNGVIHVLRQLAKHWHNMVSNQVWGNFAHQRMEQLAPFETLRTHIPAVLITLASLRGRNIWDARVLGPIMQNLTNLCPEARADTARKLLQKLQRTVVVPVCGGIPTVVEPFQSWLEAIGIALDQIEEEAKGVYGIVSSVELGIRLGYDIMSQVSWKVPSDVVLKRAILQYIRKEKGGPEEASSIINERLISSALERTTPRDKRTLMELVKSDLGDTKPAKLLLARVKTLLQREIRRDLLNEAILCLSKGSYVSALKVDDWYWMEGSKRCELFVYCGANSNGRKHMFRHVSSGSLKFVTTHNSKLRPRMYIPVAEAISRAQKVLLTIELDHGKKFKYSALMEFLPLRIALRRLAVVGQMTCEVLDNARLNILSEIQRTGRPGTSAKAVEPQNIIVIGGGPGGMMACLHCTENCLASGGVMKLFEARDSFEKGGSMYERAQIVRLDARWIAMMRYHLGTGFEDVFIPASGETDAQIGNTL